MDGGRVYRGVVSLRSRLVAADQRVATRMDRWRRQPLPARHAASPPDGFIASWLSTPRPSLRAWDSGIGLRLWLFPFTFGIGLVGMVTYDLLGINPRGPDLNDLWALPVGLLLLTVSILYLTRPVH